MTPLEIEVLLHYACSAAPHSRSSTPVVIEATSNFFKNGIIEQAVDADDVYNLTDKGRIIVKTLCDVDSESTKVFKSYEVVDTTCKPLEMMSTLAQVLDGYAGELTAEEIRAAVVWFNAYMENEL